MGAGKDGGGGTLTAPPASSTLPSSLASLTDGNSSSTSDSPFISSSSSLSKSPDRTLPSILAWFIWPLILALPLTFTTKALYAAVFPQEWYDPALYAAPSYPSPLGLTLGILAVVVGQIFMIAYHWLHVKAQAFGSVQGVQKDGPVPHQFWETAVEHLSQPEGFVMLGSYLSLTWMFRLMPASYYNFDGGVDWVAVAMQLLVQDAVQFFMHWMEHKIDSFLGWSGWFYRSSHKPHHRFTNPKLFDAFNGSVTDTFCMILVPLFITKEVVHCNVWSYMAFGTLYANWLCLIHSEVSHPWDPVFRFLGFGTAADHHVHHKLFTSNYGHLFTYCDRLTGNYKSPESVRHFNKLD